MPTDRLLVVVVDDELDKRNVMRVYLDLHLPDSIEVRAYSDVGFQDAQDSLPWDRVAVAIVDLIMPVVSGVELLRWLRDHQPACRRIAWSAAPDRHQEQLVTEQLAHTVVPKPGMDELVRLVQELLA